MTRPQPYSENADPTQITGFEIVNQLQVTVRDTDMLGELLDAAVNAGANSINGVTFYVDDQTAAASEARGLAVEDARTKAEELAAATGLTLGSVISIAEGPAHRCRRRCTPRLMPRWPRPRRPCQSSPDPRPSRSTCR